MDIPFAKILLEGSPCLRLLQHRMYEMTTDSYYSPEFLLCSLAVGVNWDA